MNDAIRVLIVEDEDLLREALIAALNIEPDIVVTSAHGDLDDARRELAHGDVDVAVVDFRLPGGNGTDLETPPTTRRLLITGSNEQRAVRAALDAGFEGFVAKGSGLSDLAQAVRVVHGGGAIFPASLLAAVNPATAPADPLTARELEILDQLAQARSLATIASEHHLSIHTVRNHVRSILMKLGAHSQLEAVVIAARSGLVDL